MEREAAVARLRVIGARAVPRIAAFLSTNPSPAARAAAIAALDGIDDPRAVDLALTALGHAEEDVALSAVAVLRGWLERDSGVRALDALTAVALDRGRDARVRLGALDALSDLPEDLVQPVLEQGGIGAASTGAAAVLDDPGAVREWIAANADRVPLSHLHDVLVRARERETAEPAARRRQEWLAARGAAHAALARRGSRIALYDLREAFEAAATPLPLDFLAAAAAVGDASCLEPMARAWALASQETWWRERLASTADDIVHRTRLSGRSAVVKRIRAKWAGFL